MGSLGWKVSALGFGAMRLPVLPKKNDKTGEMTYLVNEEESLKMIRYAIDNGVNYVDTAYPYHNGESEVIVGRALMDGYREKVHLTTKLPMWQVKTVEDFEKFLTEQIERLKTNPDIYLFHGLNKARLDKIKELGLIRKMEEARDKGLIKYIGFSFHDNVEVFKEILDYYDWDCCQVQHNYLDINYQAGTEGLQYAAKKGIAVIIMEPIRGGKLAIPENKLDTRPEVRDILEMSKIKRSMADWALQFLWNQPEVSVVLSGMSTMEQVVENVKSASNSGIGILSKEELDTISELRESFEKYTYVPCTSCGYCLPCPNNVSIPGVLRLLNEVYYWGESGKQRIAYFYNNMAKTEEDIKTKLANGDEIEGAAVLGIQCGECLDKCPQQIEIPDMMKKANAIFEENQNVSEVLD
jgi:predicted aldo/keto reductase-like oxidoreductase